MPEKPYINPEVSENTIEKEVVQMLKQLYKPTQNTQEAELFTTKSLMSKIAAIIPEDHISPIELKNELQKAGFTFKPIKEEFDFSFFWLMMPLD